MANPKVKSAFKYSQDFDYCHDITLPYLVKHGENKEN